jgi:hypothetical protein
MFLADSKPNYKTSTFVIVPRNLVAQFCVLIHKQNFYTMTEYLLIFRNASAENGYLSTSQDMAEDMPKWQSWIGHIAQQGKLVHTAPIRYEASIVNNEGVAVGPHKEQDSVLVAGFLICKADNLNEVQEWSKTCPILKYPNSSVEIRQLIPFATN